MTSERKILPNVKNLLEQLKQIELLEQAGKKKKSPKK